MDKFIQSEILFADQQNLRDWFSEVAELREVSQNFTTGINARIGLDNKTVYIPVWAVRDIAKDTQQVLAAAYRIKSARYEKFIAPE